MKPSCISELPGFAWRWTIWVLKFNPAARKGNKLRGKYRFAADEGYFKHWRGPASFIAVISSSAKSFLCPHRNVFSFLKKQQTLTWNRKDEESSFLYLFVTLYVASFLRVDGLCWHCIFSRHHYSISATTQKFIHSEYLPLWSAQPQETYLKSSFRAAKGVIHVCFYCLLHPRASQWVLCVHNTNKLEFQAK